MSLNVCVGILTTFDSNDREMSADDLDRREQLDRLNRFLAAAKLPLHAEPRFADFQWLASMKSSIEPFYAVAEAAEFRFRLDLSHVTAMNMNASWWLPVEFKTLQCVPAEQDFDISTIGSSYELYRCSYTLACLLGIYEETVGYQKEDFFRALEERLGLSPDTHPPCPELMEFVEGNSWPQGADGCFKMYEAAKASLKHRALIELS